MNPMTKHTQEQGVTYWEHWGFAMGIAFRLFISVTAFAIHAMLPFISIESGHDLEATAAFLKERNHWIESAKRSKYSRSEPVHNATRLIHV
jgi:hypothetical protein